MTENAATETIADAIEADLIYAVDTGEKLVNQTMPAGDMSRVLTGTYEHHRMRIRNGRPDREKFVLDLNGFEFVDHPTAMTDFFDADELKTVYYPEIVKLVAERSGASRVEIFDHTLRSGDGQTRQEKQVREPVKSAHNDYTVNSGPAPRPGIVSRRSRRASEEEVCNHSGLARHPKSDPGRPADDL